MSSTLTRNGAGVVSVPVTGHGVTGLVRGFVGNTIDPTYTGEVSVTPIDANNLSLVYKNPVLSAGTSAPGTNCFITQYQQTRSVGLFQDLNARASASLKFNGNFGQGGAQASEMVDAMTKCLAASPAPQIVILEAGINDIRTGGVSAAVGWASIKALIDQCIAASVPVLSLSVEPLGNGSNSAGIRTVTEGLNASMAAYAAANPTKVFFVNTYDAMVDLASPNHDSKANVQGDTVHPTPYGVSLKAPPAYAAISPLIDDTIRPMPLSSSDTSVRLGLPLVKNYGPWGTAGSGSAIGSNMTGTQAANMVPFGSGTGTGVCSLVDRGSAALGYWQQIVYTPGGSCECILFVDFGASLATAGIAVGDDIYFGVEVDASGLTGAHCKGFDMRLFFDAGGPFLGQGTLVTYEAASDGEWGQDSYSAILFSTSPIRVGAGATNMTFQVKAGFQAAGSAATLKFGRIFTRKA